MPSQTNRHEDASFPFTTLTHRTPLLPSGPSTGFSSSTHYEVVRTATLVLCGQMLRQRARLDKRESEEVRVRMRPLGRLELVWRESVVSMNGTAAPPGVSGNGMRVGADMVGEERAQRLFAKALRDGYVLCQLLNKFLPGSIPQVDAHEDGILRRWNVTRFLASCSANRFPPEDLFLPNDLVEGTSHSLARVARTIIALVKWAEGSAPINTNSLPDGGSINPNQLPPFRPLRLRSRHEIPTVTADAGDSALVPPFVGSARVAAYELPPPRPLRSPRRPPTPSPPPDTSDDGDSPPAPSADGAITHSTRDQSISPSIKNHSASPSIMNQSISPPIKKWPTKDLSTKNGSTMLSASSNSPSDDIYPSIVNQSITNQSLTGQPRVSPGSVLSHRTNDEFRMPLPRVTHATNEISPSTKNTSTQPSSEKLSISPPRTKKSRRLQKNNLVVPKVAHSPRITWWYQVRRVFAHLSGRTGHQRVPKPLQAEPDRLDTPGHTFVDATFGKSFDCRVCVKSMKKGAVRCSRCSLIAHAKCAIRAPAGCYI